MNGRSKDYHDYVFRDGRLVGEFEEMYLNSDEIPWHQDRQHDWIDIAITCEMLEHAGKMDEIHDLSCGLGYYLAHMCSLLGSPGCRGVGYDISPTACARARVNFPQLEFRTFDLTMPVSGTEVARQLEARRLFICRGTLWYVYPQLANVVQVISNVMSPADLLLVVQNFPPLDSAFIGKEVMPDPAALVGHFAPRFKLLQQAWHEDALRGGNDNWFIGVFKKKEVA